MIITDGSTGDPEVSRRVTAQLRSVGVEIVGIAYRCGAQPIADSMPGARVVDAENPMVLAAKLATIAAQVAAR